MSYCPFKSYNKNLQGRDFVVGDLHGMFSLLESQLDSLSFNPEVDRVFSVGDLIDRGPESYRVLEFLEKPWFFSIKGNHEMMLIEAKHKKTHYRSWINNNGGEWWEDMDAISQAKIRKKLYDLPVALEINCDLGNVGIVHADIPLGYSWKQLIENIDQDIEIHDYLMWSRNRFKNIQLTGETSEVEGIDLVVMGHTPVSKPLNIKNLYYIDTGASYVNNDDLGHLTLLQIQPSINSYQYPIPLDD